MGEKMELVEEDLVHALGQIAEQVEELFQGEELCTADRAMVNRLIQLNKSVKEAEKDIRAAERVKACAQRKRREYERMEQLKRGELEKMRRQEVLGQVYTKKLRDRLAARTRHCQQLQTEAEDKEKLLELMRSKARE